jgi:hypothetical protein
VRKGNPSTAGKTEREKPNEKNLDRRGWIPYTGKEEEKDLLGVIDVLCSSASYPYGGHPDHLLSLAGIDPGG